MNSDMLRLDKHAERLRPARIKDFFGTTKLAACLLSLLLVGCASEQYQTVETAKPARVSSLGEGEKITVAVGTFDNQSDFMRGIFSSGVDQLGGQAKTILLTHLQQTNLFKVLERSNLEAAAREAGYSGQVQDIQGAEYLITGDVSEFGRRNLGDKQLFGLLGRGKSQVAYAKVSLNIVRVQTMELVHATQGAGEYSLSQREVLGFGGSSSYDSTLNGKVLDLAIRDSINKLLDDIETGVWNPR